MNNFAISSSGIGEALQRSASALAEAGNTLEESIGLVTAMNTVVQDPDSVGKMYAQQYSNVLKAGSYIGQNPEMDKTEERLYGMKDVCRKESLETVMFYVAT